MVYLARLGVIIAGLVLAAVWTLGAGANYLYTLQTTKHLGEIEQYVLAGTAIGADAMKVIAALAVGMMWRRRAYLLCAGSLLVWAACVAFVVDASVGFATNLTSDAAASRGTKAAITQSLLDSLKAEARTQAWAAEQTALNNKSRVATIDGLTESRISADRLREQLKTTKPVADKNPTATVLADVGVTERQLRLYKILVWVLMLEGVAMVFPSVLVAMWRRCPAPAAPPLAPPASLQAVEKPHLSIGNDNMPAAPLAAPAAPAAAPAAPPVAAPAAAPRLPKNATAAAPIAAPAAPVKTVAAAPAKRLSAPLKASAKDDVRTAEMVRERRQQPTRTATAASLVSGEQLEAVRAFLAQHAPGVARHTNFCSDYNAWATARGKPTAASWQISRAMADIGLPSRRVGRDQITSYVIHPTRMAA